jgi:hypothetical protein
MKGETKMETGDGERDNEVENYIDTQLVLFKGET